MTKKWKGIKKVPLEMFETLNKESQDFWRKTSKTKLLDEFVNDVIKLELNSFKLNASFAEKECKIMINENEKEGISLELEAELEY